MYRKRQDKPVTVKVDEKPVTAMAISLPSPAPPPSKPSGGGGREGATERERALRERLEAELVKVRVLGGSGGVVW